MKATLADALEEDGLVPVFQCGQNQRAGYIVGEAWVYWVSGGTSNRRPAPSASLRRKWGYGRSTAKLKRERVCVTSGRPYVAAKGGPVYWAWSRRLLPLGDTIFESSRVASTRGTCLAEGDAFMGPALLGFL